MAQSTTEESYIFSWILFTQSFRKCFLFFKLFYFLALPCSMWVLAPQPETEPFPLRWDRGALNTGPPGQSVFTQSETSEWKTRVLQGFLGRQPLSLGLRPMPASMSCHLPAGFSLAFRWDLGERSGEEFTLQSSLSKINLKCFEKFLKSEFFSLLIAALKRWSEFLRRFLFVWRHGCCKLCKRT